MTFLVDEVNQRLFTIQRDLLLKVQSHNIKLYETSLLQQYVELGVRTHSILKVHDLQVWFVSQGIDLCPVHWNTSTNLHEAQFVRVFVRSARCRWRTFNEKKLLSLVEVGDMTVLVDSTAEVACPGAESRAS